jgi:CHAT domain-containing protein
LIGWLDLPGHEKAKDPNGEHWGVIVRGQGPPTWVPLRGSGPEGVWGEKDVKLFLDSQGLLHDGNIDPTLDWQSLLARLAKQRLRPLEKHLDGVQHLIVLPSAAMAGIPIETLTDKYLISYAPSGTIYAWLQENRKKFDNNDLLALGDPAFSAKQFQLALKEGDLARGRELDPLPGTRGEVETLARLFAAKGAKVQKFLGLDANFQNLEKLADNKDLARFRYLHLATHAAADARGGLNSHLCLTSAEPKIIAYHKLSAGHILRRWRLHADLVTLSACQTGLGQHQGGEGYVGFAQALLLAGSHSLVLSQWNASDWSTTLLMERFYQNLLGVNPGAKDKKAAPMPKAEALREAKRWLRQLGRQEIKDRMRDLGIMKRLQQSGQKNPEQFVDARLRGDRPFEHPFYWAPFILIGDPGNASDQRK